MNFKNVIFSAITVVLFLASCDGMKTELDVDLAAFPPKLCVTAILDGASGTFSIVLTEGRALADYKKPRPDGQKIVVNGEIRLYEDDILILSEVGEFDMTSSKRQPYFDPDTRQTIYPDRGGYRFEAPVASKPGSVYRLTVKSDKHETATAVSRMPPSPDVSASVNLSESVSLNGIKMFRSLQGWTSGGSSGHAQHFFPTTLQWGERPAGRNFYALEMHEERTLIEGTPRPWQQTGRFSRGVYVSSLSKLQDNPEIEIFDTQDIGMDMSSGNYEGYHFPILLMSDMGFASDDASLVVLLHSHIIPPPMSQSDESVETSGENNPFENFERAVIHCSWTLRVRHITEATFRYYRSLALQSAGMDFFTEPANIIGNIENGYGGFIVFSAADIGAWEYEKVENYWMGY